VRSDTRQDGEAMASIFQFSLFAPPLLLTLQCVAQRSAKAWVRYRCDDLERSSRRFIAAPQATTVLNERDRSSTETANCGYEESRGEAKRDSSDQAPQQPFTTDSKARDKYRQAGHYSGNVGKGRGHLSSLLGFRAFS
jgi:hypothetical protein